MEPRTRALLAALGRLPAAERRAVVLSHMAGVSRAEIAAVEQVSDDTVQTRLTRARYVVTEGMADVLPAVLGLETGRLTGGYGVDGYGPGAYSAARYSPPYGPDDYGYGATTGTGRTGTRPTGYGVNGHEVVAYDADGDDDSSAGRDTASRDDEGTTR